MSARRIFRHLADCLFTADPGSSTMRDGYPDADAEEPRGHRARGVIGPEALMHDDQHLLEEVREVCFADAKALKGLPEKVSMLRDDFADAGLSRPARDR